MHTYMQTKKKEERERDRKKEEFLFHLLLYYCFAES